jgi:hypothetical protein
MITEEQLKHLRSLENFRCYLDMIHSMRESAIADLAGSTAEIAQQKVGAIAAYQSLLDNAGYQQLLERKKKD